MYQSQNDRDPISGEAAVRKPWQTPQLNRLDADTAELTVGSGGDAGVDMS